MIGFIRGTVEDSLSGTILIENNGIGYEVYVPDSSPVFLKTGGKEEVILYTTMIVREDDISLYGFTEKKDLIMFKKLIGVSGVGAKAALAILSVLSAEEISKAILFDDAASITRAQGVGKKIAQRVVLELKDKIGDVSDFSISISGISAGKGDAKAEALQGLISLGYSKAQAAEALMNLEEEYDGAEKYLKEALKKLM